MKSGKSEEMLREISRKKKYAKKNVLLFKPDIDKRFSEDQSVSRDNRKEDCILVPSGNPEYILSFVDHSVDVIAIDEAQFFTTKKQFDDDDTCGYIKVKSISDVVQQLSDDGYEVLVAGLNKTSDRRPFNDMPNLLAVADRIVLLEAVCEMCGSEHATETFATFAKSQDVVIGDKEYKALCTKCYNKKK